MALARRMKQDARRARYSGSVALTSGLDFRHLDFLASVHEGTAFPAATCDVRISNFAGDILQVELPVVSSILDVKRKVEEVWGVKATHVVSNVETLGSLGTLGVVALTMVKNTGSFTLEYSDEEHRNIEGATGGYLRDINNTLVFKHIEGAWEFRLDEEDRWILCNRYRQEVVMSDTGHGHMLPPEVDQWFRRWDRLLQEPGLFFASLTFS